MAGALAGWPAQCQRQRDEKSAANCVWSRAPMSHEFSPLGGMSPLNDFCRRNQIGRSFAYEQIRDGRLIAVKAGARTYVRHEDEIARRNGLPTVIRPVERLSKTRPNRPSKRAA
jgi:hypothetical protein